MGTNRMLQALGFSLSLIVGSDLLKGVLRRPAHVARRWWVNARERGLQEADLLPCLREAAVLPPTAALQQAQEIAGAPGCHGAAWADPLLRCLAHAPALWRHQLDLAGSLQAPITDPDHLLPFLPHRVPSFLPGHRLVGDWTIRRYLGGGATGESYLAENCYLPEATPVVLKVANAGPPLGLQLLKHEARIDSIQQARGCSRVVPLLATFFNGEAPMLAYAAIQGGVNLQDLLEARHRTGRIPEPWWVARVMHRVALALDELHRCGLVHRDIKPSNLVLGRLGTARSNIHVIDKGIAGPVGSLSLDEWELGDETRKLVDRLLLYAHTEQFASPEQLRQDQCWPTSDIFSTGAVAVLSLSGEFHQRFDKTPWQTVMEARGAPRPFIELLEQCTDPIARRRPADGGDLAARLAALDYERWPRRRP